MIHLDTHALVWLAQGRADRFPAGVRQLLEAYRPLVSPMVRLELAFLYDIGRISAPADQIIEALRTSADLGIAESSFDRVASVAATVTWTRDPFDRLIAAHALADDVPLITKDARMLTNCKVARWE